MTSPRKNHAHGLNLAVARALTNARKRADLTNEGLAALLPEISMTSVQRYLSGRAAIDVEVLSRLCEAIGVTEVEVIQEAEKLMGEDDDRPLRLAARKTGREPGGHRSSDS